MTTTPAQTQSPRLDSLTGLRFVAAALIVGRHASYLFGNRHIATVLQRGGIGVSFFFVLSGFVLTWTARSGDGRLAFYRRRFARVYPTHALTLVAALLVGSEIATNHFPSPLTLLACVGLVQSWSSDPSVFFGGNGVAWSLSCEAFFYAVFPLLLLQLRGRSPRQWLVVGGTAAFAILTIAVVVDPASQRGIWFRDVLPPVRLLEFVLGVVLALLMRHGQVPRIPLPLATTLTTATLALTFVFPLRLTVALMVPSFVVLIAAAAQSDLAGSASLLSRRWFVKLGEWSFALYLVHMLWFQPVLSHYGDAHFSTVAGVLVASLLAGLALLTAAAVHELWEKPWERRLRGAPGFASEPSTVRPAPVAHALTD